MVQLLCVVLCVITLAMVLGKKIEDLLPSVFMMAVVFVYSLAVLRIRLDVASYVVMGLCFAISIVCICVVLGKTQGHSVVIKELLVSYVTTPAIFVFITVSISFWLLFSSHKIFNWDDLSYWGIYLKDIFVLKRLPLGVENCTISYKDYNPVMQIFEYFFMFRDTDFNEARPFQINVCFMYMLILPFLRGINVKKHGRERIGTIVTIILFIIFPHIFTTQFYYKLGVDYLMSLLFGYGIWVICDKDNEGFMNLFRVIIVSTFLVLIKTAGVVLALFLILFYALYNCDKCVFGKIVNPESKQSAVISFFANGVLVGFIPMCYYLSWKLWGRRTGNNGYLSDKVESNVRSLIHNFPDYTGQVVLNYIKHIFTYPLTREKVGITAFGMILIIVLIYSARKMAGVVMAKDKRLFIALMVGLFIFCLAHIYMYLFVFDDWEAYGLLEFDRYINQYLAGVLYFYLCDLWADGQLVSNVLNQGDFLGKKDSAICRVILRSDLAVVFLVVLIALLPYPSIKQYIIPANYDRLYSEKYQKTYDDTCEEWGKSALKEMMLPLDDTNKVMLMGNAWLDEFQFFTVQMVPQAVTVVENIPALEEGRVSAFCRDLIKSRGIEYIYVLNGTSKYYAGDFAGETCELTVDGASVEDGVTYKVIRDNDEIFLEKIR